MSEAIPTPAELEIKSEVVCGAPVVSVEQAQVKKADEEVRAKYKIEVMFSKHRSSLPNKPSPFMLLIWESGKKLHGGGDDKMYWCGYDDCVKPMSSDNFGYYHVVCPSCHREQFLDSVSRSAHAGAEGLPIVVGERLGNLIPKDLAFLLAKTWRSLDFNADIYLKYSPHEIRYDPKFETTGTRDSLSKARGTRETVIYPLKNILQETQSGASLEDRIVTLLVA